jgi:hypothetical protein
MRQKLVENVVVDFVDREDGICGVTTLRNFAFSLLKL